MNFNALPLLITFSSGLLVLFVQQFARPRFSHFGVISIFLDSAPNFIVGFCFPFCVLIRPRLFTLSRARKFFDASALATLLILLVFEMERPFEGAETFDYLDVLASFFGVASAFLFYRLRLERNLTFRQSI